MQVHDLPFAGRVRDMALVQERMEVSKEVYERAKELYEKHGHQYYWVASNHPKYAMTREDREKLFDEAIRFGYGLYGAHVYEYNGKYYCEYERGSSCD